MSKKINLKSLLNEAFENVVPYAGRSRNQHASGAITEDQLEKLGIMKKSNINEEYIELMPDINKALSLIKEDWLNWKKGPLTEPSDIKPAQKELMNYVISWMKKNIK
tara:strand:- start:2978 stop:3298 length:321 start_codon:yes stop_codon:yes gene_type:complete